MINLKNKTAIITGASRGIGKQISLSLAKNECNLFILSRSIKDLETLKDEITKQYNVKVYCLNVDIKNYKAVEKTFKKILSKTTKIDILVNNAGVTKDNIIIRMSEDEWQDVINTNLTGCFNCCKSIIKHMIKQRNGRIINISSIIGITGNAGQVNYAASKAGVIALTKSLSKEVGSRNITVNAIAPGYIDTEMTKTLNSNLKNNYLNSISLKRFGNTEDVANLVCFLSCNLASYITGQTINIDGGIN